MCRKKRKLENNGMDGRYEKSDCGAQIGIVDGDKEDKVYQYKEYSAEQWIINAYTMDGAMLYREINVTEIPDGLESEYDWNDQW